MSQSWEDAIERVAVRHAAMDALPPEVKDLLESLRARWLYAGQTKHYENVRDECLRIWGSK